LHETTTTAKRLQRPQYQAERPAVQIDTIGTTQQEVSKAIQISKRRYNPKTKRFEEET